MIVSMKEAELMISFSGGNDVFVDIGNKYYGVRACQKYLGGIEGSQTLHVGDQFLSAGANDFKVRTAVQPYAIFRCIQIIPLSGADSRCRLDSHVQQPGSQILRRPWTFLMNSSTNSETKIMDDKSRTKLYVVTTALPYRRTE